MMKLVFICIGIFSLISCGRTNSLTPEDYEWMPYKGNEMLIFISNTKGADTIFLLKKDTIIAYPEAQKINGIEYEVVAVFCRHSDFGPLREKVTYQESFFLEIEKNIDKHATISFHLNTKDAAYSNLKGTSIETLKNMKPITFETGYHTYDDVYIIKAVDYLGISVRSDYVSKLYWSKSKGLIRYDLNDGSYWELAECK